MHPEVHIQEKLNEALKTKPAPSMWKLWIDVSLYSLLMFALISAYYFATRGGYDLRAASRAIADVGVFLIGLSFMLSGLCYFWNFADHFIIYRKQLGVIGFIYVATHGLIVLLRSRTLDVLIPSSLTGPSDIAIMCAEIAVIMYLGMIIISTKTVIHEIGGQRWRQLLRYGYIAFTLSLIHFIIRDYGTWLAWLMGTSSNIFPPVGLLVFLFGLSVLILRIRLWIALHLKKAPTPISPSTTPPAVATQQSTVTPSSSQLTPVDTNTQPPAAPSTPPQS
ncbi:hypothetical protein BH09PAT2_BH09PAT2_01780 [soil metagenome]